MPPSFSRHPSSYRDPSGFVFWKDNILYRQVNKSFRKDFDHFIESGFYTILLDKKAVLPFEIINENFTETEDWFATLKPEFLPFISYPWEWTFGMLKDAALLTLNLASDALEKGLMLKDATPFNIQFYNGRPLLIDSLSFESLDAAKPWIAYRQFCECFLAPLALMHYLQTPLQPLLLTYPEGIPLEVAAKMLPLKSKFRLPVFLHLHLHSRYSGGSSVAAKKDVSFSKIKFRNILESLHKTISNFQLNHKAVWSNYYDEAEKRPQYLEPKKKIIEDWVDDLMPVKTAIDLGANDGAFSELLAARNIFTISADFDHFSLETLYQKIKTGASKNIQPLLLDLSNPSAAVGVNNKERFSFIDRVKTDLVLALAVIHHLCIGKNIPFEDVAFFFQQLGKNLIIEFVAKEDEKIQLMLSQKKDIYPWYTIKNFESNFSKYYTIIKKEKITGTSRTLYLMRKNEA